jgi:hypothetical protein
MGSALCRADRVQKYKRRLYGTDRTDRRSLRRSAGPYAVDCVAMFLPRGGFRGPARRHCYLVIRMLTQPDTTDRRSCPLTSGSSVGTVGRPMGPRKRCRAVMAAGTAPVIDRLCFAVRSSFASPVGPGPSPRGRRRSPVSRPGQPGVATYHFAAPRQHGRRRRVHQRDGFRQSLIAHAVETTRRSRSCRTGCMQREG